MLFAASETSQEEDSASRSFFFHSSVFSKPFPENRTLCFLDHLVMVTRSSTCTSLTSNLEGWTLSNCTMERTDEVEGEGEKDSFRLGDDWWLPSGLIWVAISLLETSREILVAASLFSSIFHSVCFIQGQQVTTRIINQW